MIDHIFLRNFPYGRHNYGKIQKKLIETTINIVVIMLTGIQVYTVILY